jgi:KDO2-lipid IV(A) lauroyltransferase
MPDSMARSAFDAGAFYAALGGGPEQLRKNLARVVGVPPAEVPGSLIRASLASYARYWREAFRLPSMDLARLGRELVINGENLDAGLAAGRGVITALPHSGNWDMAGVWLAQMRGTFTTVAERLKPESVFEMFKGFREGLGMEVVPLDKGATAFGVLAQRLRAGNMVCLLVDRDLTENGVEVDFFGEKARMAAGAAALAVQTGAPLRAVTLYFTDGGWVADVSEEILVPPEGDRRAKAAAMTQQLAGAFEKGIIEHPYDWHMLQRVFLADLDASRLPARPAADGGAADSTRAGT